MSVIPFPMSGITTCPYGFQRLQEAEGSLEWTLWKTGETSGYCTLPYLHDGPCVREVWGQGWWPGRTRL